MIKKNQEVMKNILYAVETGGQVYGKHNYASLIGAGHNTSNEVAITIGAGQWYATEAKTLLNKILSKYPKEFKSMDTAGIQSDLTSKNWSKYSISVGSDKAKCIVKIISSEVGIKCQDELMLEQINTYSEEITKTYGKMADTAMMECINIKHQGGSGALKRILGKTTKPYTLDKIYATLNLDPADKSSNNQVGDYVTRQKIVYKFIKTYAVDEESNSNKEDTSMGQTAQDYLNVWRGWLGFSEANGKFKQIIDLYNSMKPLPRGYAVQYDDEWCDTTVSAAAIAAKMVNLIGRECGCEEHVKIFKQLGIWEENGTITPKPGYIIVYNWDSKVQPNDGRSDHIGVVESVSNGMITCIEGNKGETVARRVLSVGNGYIRGYAKPRYSGQGTAPATPSKPASGSTSSDISKTVQWTGTVNTAELNVRTWAGTENSQLKSYPTVKQGTKVGVCDTIKDKDGDPWYFVKIDGDKGEKYGFVSAAYITRNATSDPTKVPDNDITKNVVWTGVVTADVLNVRTWAGTNNAKLKSYPSIKNGTRVGVCDSVYADDHSLWYFIKISGSNGDKYGFVHSAYISRT